MDHISFNLPYEEVRGTANCHVAVVKSDNVTMERHAIGMGTILRCMSGRAELLVNFDIFTLTEGEVIIFFPSETVMWLDMSEDFRADVLRYSPGILRESCLQIEHTTYSLLKKHRKLLEPNVCQNVVGSMFVLLRQLYDSTCHSCFERIVIRQLEVFFLGFYDYSLTDCDVFPSDGSKRTNDLFGKFMEMLEDNYLVSRKVEFYADSLCITAKYLTMIVVRKTGLTPKKMIDEYVILQMKLMLRSPGISAKEVASQFSFSDMSFFTRYFKSHTGITPSAFQTLV